ncbi:MAG: bifunctional serine/threonine-protein kinase/formylglycine-generating enzyme family protein [Myxococcota bacterium]|nr:bifunctional serine/threonine-protein kinase/formylglycine-generating enzyme family protein [Myxococcota bacterium]
MTSKGQTQFLSRLRDRFSLSEEALEQIQYAVDHEGRSLADVLVDLGIVTQNGLKSVIGELPTVAGDVDDLVDGSSSSERSQKVADEHDDLRAMLLPPMKPGFDRYDLGDELARGGMGRIVETVDTTLERSVAMKLLLGGKGQRLGWQLRFAQEAQITGQLQHPNIIPVYDLGERADGQLYFTMKRVDGQTLRDVFKGLRADDPDMLAEYTRTHLLQVFQKICMAVAYAHSRSVVHRDLKPSNIMIGGYGEVLVMDWGLAKILKKEASGGQKVKSHREELGRLATRQGEAIGTPGYMPPELALGQLHLVDDRSDVFSLGAILYEMLTLKRPYAGRDAQTILQKMLRSPVKPARLRAPDRNIPIDLDEACSRCLERDVSKRYESVLELHHAVQRHLEAGAEAFEQPSVFSTSELEQQVAQYMTSVEREKVLRDEVKTLKAKEVPWSSLDERRITRKLIHKHRLLDEQVRERFSLAGDVLNSRLIRDPSDTAAKATLAEIASAEFRRCDEIDDAPGLAQCRRILTRLNVHAELLRGDGQLEIETNPPGLMVKLYRITEVDSVLTPIRKDTMASTPVSITDLPMGPYLVSAPTASGRDVRASFRIGRCQRLKLNLNTLAAARVPDGFLYIPAGHAQLGLDDNAAWPTCRDTVEHPAFCISRLPVTMRDYMRFLNALARTDLSRALQHAPKNPLTGEQLLSQMGASFYIPRSEFSGQTWDPNWPVFGVTRDDAIAFCRWRARRDSLSYRLPTSQEWEIAARGGDGRAFPWGDHWEASFCNTAAGQLGLPSLAPVGSHPNDRSPYGLMDLAGGVTEWTSTDIQQAGKFMAICRGGRWNGSVRDSRCASRHPMPPSAAHLGVGFRLALNSAD